MSDDSKQDSATTTAHIKLDIKLFNKFNILSNTLSTILENTDGCAEHYICATALCLMSMLSQTFSVIIDHSISAPEHGRKVVDGLNATEKRFLFQLISGVQLPGEKGYDTYTVMHTGTSTYNVILAREFLKHLSTVARKHGVIGQGKYKKRTSK